MKRRVKHLITGFAVISLLVSGTPAYANDVTAERSDRWSMGMEEYGHAISSVHVSEHDTFEDLAFLKPVLEGKRIVMLGETSHGAKEFNGIKGRIVRYLHEELGYNVLAFESPLGQATAAQASAPDASAKDTLSEGIFPVWHAEETLKLFHYMDETEETEKPLMLTGIDVQADAAFGPWLSGWVKTLDGDMADTIQSTEEEFVKLYHQQQDESLAVQEAAALIRKYEAIQTFIETHQKDLEAAFSAPVAASVERVLHNRLSFLNDGVSAQVHMNQLFNGASTEPAESWDEDASYRRDLGMADNLAWLANDVYPDEKIIVWGHNYHTRKQNSTMHEAIQVVPNKSGYIPTLGELVPEKLKGQTYSIGLFAHHGTTLANTGEEMEMAEQYNPYSIEEIMTPNGKQSTFVDVTKATDPSNTWMVMPVNGSYWGMFQETFLPYEQYDGLLMIDRVTPATIVK
ncbi:erythromycin esterase family protein [Bacillaceae bacterium SIJ1]|uniref:erythromycin esterase family protein n=1 Tax=Litoribacterium kuwaitense TaxID=1398745 RepID=UPI0013ED5CF1|nr:erythromycin esterase family protein [Litoribacterium kuwaitense]NGP44773.1 erythromycin esterase family protein [Litoribacterium kuwaitense]